MCCKKQCKSCVNQCAIVANLSPGPMVAHKTGLSTSFPTGSVENAKSEVIRFNDDVMLLKVDEKDCFVFSFGCLVCWGCTPQEVGAARDYVQGHLAKPVELAQVEVDFLSITGNASALPIATKARKIIFILFMALAFFLFRGVMHNVFS